jgi:hypothetical protein
VDGAPTTFKELTMKLQRLFSVILMAAVVLALQVPMAVGQPGESRPDVNARGSAAAERGRGSVPGSAEEAAKRGEAARQQAEQQVDKARESAEERGQGQAAERAKAARESAAGGPGQGQGQAMRQVAADKQAEAFERIHQQRMAQIKRIRELAVEKDNQELLERADQLAAREAERHARQKTLLERRASGNPGNPKAQ